MKAEVSSKRQVGKGARPLREPVKDRVRDCGEPEARESGARPGRLAAVLVEKGAHVGAEGAAETRGERQQEQAVDEVCEAVAHRACLQRTWNLEPRDRDRRCFAR